MSEEKHKKNKLVSSEIFSLGPFMVILFLILAAVIATTIVKPHFSDDKTMQLIWSQDTDDKDNKIIDGNNILIVLGVLHDPIKKDSIQVISITAYEPLDRSWLKDLTISATISKGTEVIKSIQGTTNDSGRLIYEWEIDANVEPGMYIVKAEGKINGELVTSEPLYFLVEQA